MHKKTPERMLRKGERRGKGTRVHRPTRHRRAPTRERTQGGGKVPNEEFRENPGTGGTDKNREHRDSAGKGLKTLRRVGKTARGRETKERIDGENTGHCVLGDLLARGSRMRKSVAREKYSSRGACSALVFYYVEGPRGKRQ